MDVARQVFSVLLVFALLGTCLWFARRGGRITFRGLAGTRIPKKTKSLTAVERLVLTPQHTLHLVRIDGRELVIATHPQGCSVVSEPAKRAMGAEA